MEITFIFLTAVVAIRPELSNQVGEAYAKQARLDTTLNAFKDRTLTAQEQSAIANVALLTNAIAKRQVAFSWNFP